MLAPLLASLCCGLFLAPFFSLPAWWVTIPTILAGAALCTRTSRAMPLLLCLALASSAPLLYQRALHPPRSKNDLRLLADDKVHELSGRILQAGRSQSGRWRIDLDQLREMTGSRRPLRGRLRLYVEFLDDRPPVGARLQFTTRLRLPRHFGTPGEFDYPRYLANRDIRATGYTRSRVSIEPVEKSMLLPLWLTAHRQATADWLERHFQPNQSALLKALLLGDRDNFPTKLRERVSRAGLSHLLAISGLHLGLLGWFLYQLLLVLYRRSTRLLLWQPPARVIPLLLVIPLCLYTLFTGGALSTWRALVMFGLAALLLPFGWRLPPLQVLQLALFGILLLQPLALFEPGLQLSAAGVASILLLLPRWKRSLSRTPRWLQRVTEIPLATVAATLGTLPLVGLHFHQFIPAGLICNLFAIPLVGFAALPIGLGGILAHLLDLPGSLAALRASAWLLESTLDLADRVTTLAPLTARPWYPDPWQLAASLAAILGLVLFSRAHWRRGALLLIASLVLLNPRLASPPQGLTLTAFAVGQGEALLLTRPDGSSILVDGGGLRHSSFDVGERLLAPALGWLGRHHLDAVIMTHAHPDHWRGLIAVLKNLTVDRFITALPEADLPPEIAAALQEGTELMTLKPGWQNVSLGTDKPLRIWVPDQRANSLNDRSLALLEGHGDDRLLLTGDLQARGIHDLLKPLPSRQVSLLKLPHHGSRYSAPAFLLDQVQPQIAVVSAGYRNSYHLPSDRVLELCAERGVRVLRTDLMQTVRCQSRGHGWRTRFWNRGWFRRDPEPQPAETPARPAPDRVAGTG